MHSLNHILGDPYTTLFTSYMVSYDRMGALHCYNQYPCQEQVPHEEDYSDEFDEF